MTLSADLKALVNDHQPHGQLTGDADEPTPTGYRVWISCPCGVTFERLVGRRVPQYASLAWWSPPALRLPKHVTTDVEGIPHVIHVQAPQNLGFYDRALARCTHGAVAMRGDDLVWRVPGKHASVDLRSDHLGECRDDGPSAQRPAARATLTPAFRWSSGRVHTEHPATWRRSGRCRREPYSRLAVDRSQYGAR